MEVVRGVRPRAGFGQRFGAYLIDVVVTNVVVYIIAAFIKTGGASLVM